MNMRNSLRCRFGWWLASLVLVAIVGVALAEDDASGKQFYLPAVIYQQPSVMDCNVPGGSFTTLSIIGPPITVNPETDRYLNLGVRGYKRVDAPLQLVQLGPVHDSKSPQFPGIFGDRRTPTFTNAYDTAPNSQWEVTLLGMGTNPAEIIYTADSGYDIGGGYEYLVLYAAETRVTLHIGREDGGARGYVLYIEDVCVDPDLVALYRQSYAAGRQSLPVLRGHAPFGRAIGNEVKVAVRDTGSFMDPRSRNDWWQGR